MRDEENPTMKWREDMEGVMRSDDAGIKGMEEGNGTNEERMERRDGGIKKRNEGDKRVVEVMERRKKGDERVY